VSKPLADLALDSNAVIAYFGGDVRAVAWIDAADALFIPVVCVGELEFGARHSARVEDNLKRLESLLEQGVILDITRDTARIYAEIRQALTVRGTPIPESDLWIAACCLQSHLPLLSEDTHFDVVPGLKRYEWTKPVSP
jgi:tRNA(fMet)-specific endonuclease VapC